MMGERETFGAMFKRLRLASGQALSAFCRQHDFAPATVSKLEHNVLAPPVAEEVLAKYAEALGLKRGTRDWNAFFDRAAVSRGRVPHSVKDDDEARELLPALYRVLRGEANEADRRALKDKCDT